MAQPTASSTEHKTCICCDAPITGRDKAMNDTDSEDWDGEYVCCACMDKAAGFAVEFFARNLDVHEVTVFPSCSCDHCEQYGGTNDAQH